MRMGVGAAAAAAAVAAAAVKSTQAGFKLAIEQEAAAAALKPPSAGM